MRSSGGFVLLLVGALGLIGFLTGNLDRWLAFLFSPGGSATGAGVSVGTIPTAARAPAPSTNQRVS